jgi:hypothetical protein
MNIATLVISASDVVHPGTHYSIPTIKLWIDNDHDLEYAETVDVNDLMNSFGFYNIRPTAKIGDLLPPIVSPVINVDV